MWDAMCAIYRCLILSSLYQPGSNNVMRNIILLKFIFCLWCLMSDRQCHRFQPESDLQSKLLSGCFPGIVLDLWTLVSECCFFFLLCVCPRFWEGWQVWQKRWQQQHSLDCLQMLQSTSTLTMDGPQKNVKHKLVNTKPKQKWPTMQWKFKYHCWPFLLINIMWE